MLDFTKPLQTLDGKSVKIISTEGRGQYPVLGYVGNSKDLEGWTLSGLFDVDYMPSQWNLMNIPEKKTLYLNIYPDDVVAYDNRVSADKGAGGNRIACVKVEYAKGQFDD